MTLFRLFTTTEFLSAQQILSLFSRLAGKLQQQVQVMEQDVLAVEEQVNFTSASDSVLSSLHHISHPIQVVDQYNVCNLVTCEGLLQVLCEGSELEVPAPAVRMKAPNIAVHLEVEDSCPCSLK